MRRALIALGIGLSVLGSAVVTAPAEAASVATVPLARTSTAAQEVAEFWLADGAANLRDATPYEVGATKNGERLSADVPPDGPPVSLAPMEAPDPATSGKVFFIGDDGRPHWCTGTAVRSSYRNTVATAAHCVFNIEAPMGALGAWVFVPAYTEGATPYGLYVGKQGNTHYDYDDIRDHGRNYAFVNVYNGVVSSASAGLTDVGRLGDNVGGQGIAFNQPIASTVDVLGYPAGPHPDGTRPYTGESLERSTGSRFAVRVTVARADRLVGVDSPFTGAGSLGSAWLTGYSDETRTGYLNGITTSVSDTDGDGRYDTGISSYFDRETIPVYQHTSGTWTGRFI
ncbi:hypothetical protein AB0J42_29425 [Nonomuraea sp. NPDC049649]|uniref:trypsin-like serine peptidase n=1 Tax=Nonomuraea sp. NPDC049649 TaxID=3155776 RepID=UPI0034222604